MYSGKYLSRARHLGIEHKCRDLIDQLKPYIVAITAFEVSDNIVTNKLKEVRFNDWFTSPVDLEVIQKSILEKVISINQKQVVG